MSVPKPPRMPWFNFDPTAVPLRVKPGKKPCCPMQHPKQELETTDTAGIGYCPEGRVYFAFKMIEEKKKTKMVIKNGKLQEVSVSEKTVT